MTVWMLAVIALLPSFAVTVIYACHGAAAHRLVALQLASSLAAWLLVLMTFAFDQSSFIDLALTLVLLTLPGTLVMAQFLERWL